MTTAIVRGDPFIKAIRGKAMVTKYWCAIYNDVKDTTLVTPIPSDIRVCIKGYSGDAIYIHDFNGVSKHVEDLIEGERVVMAWDRGTKNLVHLKRIKITKDCKIIVNNYISKNIEVEDIPTATTADLS